MKVGIVGLGLIGGSMAKAYRAYSDELGLDFEIYGYDINSSLSAYYFNPSAKIWDEIMTKVHEKYITEAANGGKPLKEFDLEDVDDLYPTDEEIEDAKEEMDIGAWKEDLVSKPEDGEE